MDEHYLGEHYQDGGEVDPPEKTVKAYKLFRTNSKKPGQLFPLFVDANTPVPIGKWVAAKAGDPGKDPTKVKSKLGDLAYRPGWHAGDLPVATHIGGKSSPDLKAPDYRPDNHVWAEIEMPDDIDWQSVANSRMERTKAGAPKPATAHITDQVPFGGHYRYKTNPNMTGNWMIGGSMKVNRVLGDDEVKAINDSNGVADLPRLARADGGEVEDGITAYHGSPHDFDEFDTSKIGTGEGAQAYGHGLYFAGHEPVAKQYRDQLSSPDNFKILKASGNAHIPHAGLIQEIGHEVGEGVGQSQDEFKKAILNGLSARTKDADQYYKEDLEIVANSIKRGDWNIIPKNYGHMYEVHINAHPHHFLDWDKPLSEQSEHVQKILGGRSIFEGDRALGEVLGRAYKNELFGGDVAQMDRAKPYEVSESLARQGIKGIKYQDAGSRGAGQYDLHVMYKGKPHSDPIPMMDKAQAEHHAKEYQAKGYDTEVKPRGTHNYVVFDHNDVHIKRKYEQGGAVEGFADGGDVWDDSRIRRSGEGGTETALDFIQNAPLYKQRMEAQAPQPAPVAAPSTEGKSMPVTAAPPPAIVQPAQPVQQKQEAPQAQGQVGLYAVGTNDPNPDMTVQSAQRIIESSRAMGINPVFLLPNQAGNTQYAQNSRALQKYLDENSIQYQMPQYGDKDPLHMTPSWASGAAKSYNAPFLAGDSNSVRLGIVGYGAKGDGKTIVHPESGAVLGRVGANSKAVADELERHLKWQMQNRTQRNTGGPVTVSKGQDTAGNFKKEHEKIHGIPVAVEVKEGHDRVKYEPDGSLKFKAKQYADYGAILGTKDADGMNTDVMVGPHKDSNKAYIIDQRKHSTGKFDEHKVMLGFNKRKKAIKAYTKSYADRHGKDRVQDVVKTDIAGLKKWLKHGNLKVAAAKDALINRALEVVSK